MTYLNIRHSTYYTYSKKVFPGTHYLYFHPHPRPYLRVQGFEIQVDPQPAGIAGRIDKENNLYYQLWYLDKVDHLTITVNTRVMVSPFNPYDFLLDPPLELHKPVKYTAAPPGMLDPYLQVHDMSEDMKQFLDDFIANSNNGALDFFARLTAHVSSLWDHQIRMEENVYTPRDCFQKKAGSCRDLAWMLINMLRYKGYASRFVSGYSYVPGMKEGHELHAWVEVLLPGAGWLAVDPSLGLLVTENYIPLATSFDPSNTMPVQGSYMGSARSEMNTEVVISQSAGQP